MEPEPKNNQQINKNSLNFEVISPNFNDTLVDSSFDASIELPARDFETFDQQTQWDIPSESQMDSIMSILTGQNEKEKNKEKENLDPLTDTLEPKRRPTGSIRRSVLKDITEKFLRTAPENEEIEREIEQNDEQRHEDDEFFSALTDLPLENKNIREL